LNRGALSWFQNVFTYDEKVVKEFECTLSTMGFLEGKVRGEKKKASVERW
jgi:hypothetical protein